MSETPTEAPAETVFEDAAGILELSAAAHLDDLQFADGKTTFGATAAGLNLGELVAEHGAVVVVRQAGGLRMSWQTSARLPIEVYAATYADVWAAQRAVEKHLADRWRPTPDGALRIDSWRNESAASEFMHPPLYALASSWRITSRDL